MNPELIKKDNENQLDYIKRLVTGKLINRDIAEDYAELSELVFGKGNNFNSSEVRKRFYGIKRIFDILDSERLFSITDSEVLKKIEQEKLSLQKEKVRLQDQRREYKKLITIDARFEALLDEVNKVVDDLNLHKPLLHTFYGDRYVPVNNDGVLLLSDWHSESQVDNFLNKFNKEEFLRRIKLLTQKTIEYGKFHKIKTLHIFELGDLLNGFIHVGSRVANDELTVTQTMIVSEVLAEMLSIFGNTFEKVNFYHILDNHSRVFANKDESVMGESFARFIPWYLKPRLNEFDNIHILEDNSLDEEIIVTDVCGQTIFGVHGHYDKLDSVVGDLALMIKKIPDYVFVSHWHHNIEDEFHSCELIVNQSLIGSDDYSKRIRKTSKPAQKFMIFNEDVGRLCTYNIKLK